jgi:hypothetical protein
VSAIGLLLSSYEAMGPFGVMKQVGVLAREFEWHSSLGALVVPLATSARWTPFRAAGRCEARCSKPVTGFLIGFIVVSITPDGNLISSLDLIQVPPHVLKAHETEQGWLIPAPLANIPRPADHLEGRRRGSMDLAQPRQT